MAQAVKVPPTSNLNIHSSSNNRDGALSQVASISTATVDAVNPGVSGYFDNNPFSFSRQNYADHGNDNRQKVIGRDHFGRLNTSSESFVALMELNSLAFASGILEKNKNSLLTISPTKAILNYETNSELVEESVKIRGSSLSLLL